MKFLFLIPLSFFILFSSAQKKKSCKEEGLVYRIVPKIDTTLYKYDLDSANNKNYYIDSIGKKFYIHEGIESEFIGEKKAWIKYLVGEIILSGLAKELTEKDFINNRFQQTAIVEFTVCIDGSIREIEVVNKVIPYVEYESIRVIKKSPNWKPAEYEGKKIKSRKQETITFRVTQ